MTDKFLLDTNILIYYTDGLLTNWTGVDEIFETSFLISVISKIEFLGWAGFRGNQNQFAKAKEFLSNSFIYYLDDEIAEETIILRQKCRIKMPDAVIAATALTNGLTLVTGNISDFEKTGVKMLVPEL